MGTEGIVSKLQLLIPVAGGTAVFGSAALVEAVSMGLLWHSRFNPAVRLQLGTGDGSSSYFPLPVDCLSVRHVELPYGATPPMYLAEWYVHPGTSGLELCIPTPPGSGEVFGIHYSGIWTAESLPERDRGPVALLAGAWVCMSQAARMAEVIGTTISADVVDYRGLATTWTNLKDHLISLYAQSQGLSAEAVRSGAPPPAWGLGVVPQSQHFPRWHWD